MEESKEKLKQEQLEKVSGGVQKQVKLLECPTCGSTRTTEVLSFENGARYSQYKCLDCGSFIGNKTCIDPPGPVPVAPGNY